VFLPLNVKEMDKMDKEKGKAEKARWDWLPARMPGVVKLMADQRAEVGAAWVNECWRRGVLEGQPGWFWASEGALSVGTLWEDPAIVAFSALRLTPTQALVVLRPKEEGVNGSN
jgi:hypothetical protein